MDKQVKEGTGWRVGWNPSAEQYQGLIGGENWAFELTALEFKEFCRLFQQLTHSMTMMAEELMDEEKITCEVESEIIWLEAEGYPDAYEIRIILHQGRRCEGYWSENAIPDLIQAVADANVNPFI